MTTPVAPNTSVTVRRGENAVIPVSDPGLAGSTLNLRKFAALTQLSNEVMSDSRPDVGNVAGEDLMRRQPPRLTLADVQVRCVPVREERATQVAHIWHTLR